mmetsp:Transcript_48548/g.113663  ORF Transcript_48548/g.113663 Transcript_48548/m.113663 type:complete len:157 (-) Transcript_48548:132-602(-)
MGCASSTTVGPKQATCTNVDVASCRMNAKHSATEMDTEVMRPRSAHEVVLLRNGKVQNWRVKEHTEPHALQDFHSGTCTPVAQQRHWVPGQPLPPDMQMSKECSSKLLFLLDDVATRPQHFERRIFSARLHMEKERDCGDWTKEAEAAVTHLRMSL